MTRSCPYLEYRWKLFSWSGKSSSRGYSNSLSNMMVYVTIFFAYPRRTPVYSDVVSFAVYSALVLSFLYLARGTVVRWVMGRGLREMTSISLSVAVTLPVVPRAPLLILLAAVAIKT